MLTAFTHGKGRRAATDVAAGSSVRKVLSASEDMLTSAVFERLAYLNDTTLWSVLQRAFRLPAHTAAEDAELMTMEFWPMLSGATARLGQSVEPDLVMRFAFAEGRSLALIVECKLDAQQAPAQWAQEWIAWRAEEQAEPEEITWLLALGGLPHRAEETVERFCAEILRTYGIQINAAAADWTDMLEAIGTVEFRTRGDARVLNDVREALGLFGVRSFKNLGSLCRQVTSDRLRIRSITALGRLT